MKTHNLWIFVLAAFFCGALFCTQAFAKVCFVGEPNCSGGGNFGEYQPNDNGELCIKEGYIAKTECAADPSRHIIGYCPYNKDYVMCCGNEYVYDSCVYPHITVGKCGNKFKCQCDPEKYPYTEDTCHKQFKFSNPGGTACTQIDAGKTSTTKTLYYSACLCERGLFPYSKNDCQETANADVNGEPCQDSMGNQYWDSCKCSNPPYKWESVDCEFGGKGKACVQGGVYFFKECCSCAAFPAEGERGGRPNDPYATKWTTCDCPRKGRFRITQCKQGWQPNKDGSACERISCESAVKLFFSKERNQQRYSQYGVFVGDGKGNRLVHYRALTEAEKALLPEAEQTYAVGEEIDANSASIGVLAGNVRVVGKERCLPLMNPNREYEIIGGYNIGCTKANDIYSGAYFGVLSSSSDHKMLQESCGSYEPEKTVVPVMSFLGSYFPSRYGSKGVHLYGMELKFTGNFSVSGIAFATAINAPMYLHNANLSGSGAAFNKIVRMDANRSMPNGENATYKVLNSTFIDNVKAEGYNFDVGNLYLEAPESYKNKIFANFNLLEGNYMKGSIALYPNVDQPTVDWGTSMSFTGPLFFRRG